MATRWPAYVNMCSYQHTTESIKSVFREHLKYYDASGETDCVLSDILPDPYYKPDGSGLGNPPQVHYRLTFFTYKGWRVYQLHTGAFSFIPGEEIGN